MRFVLSSLVCSFTLLVLACGGNSATVSEQPTEVPVEHSQQSVLTTAEAKAAILENALRTYDSGAKAVVVTPEFSIEYAPSPDTFWIGIASDDMASAKIAAESWFVDHGLTTEGLCELKIIFYSKSKLGVPATRPTPCAQ